MINLSERRTRWLIAGLWIVFALIVFRAVLGTGAILFSTDDNIGHIAARKAWLPSGWFGCWDDRELVGSPSLLGLNFTNLLLWILPVRFFVNWIHAIDLVLASIFLMLYLRELRIGWTASFIGALAAFWVGSNLTLTYAGHTGKFGVLLFAALALWLQERAVRHGGWHRAVLAGGALGAMFLEQADVALFFALIWGPCFLFRLYRGASDWNTRIVSVAAYIATAFLLAFAPLWQGYQTAVEGTANVSNEDPLAKWNFVTQWSWPPEESIDFIAPGFMGLRSGEAEGPYYGRMGRSPEWEESGQGFQNFKLESQYLGAIPLVAALWALLFAWIPSKKTDEKSAAPSTEIMDAARFWSVAAIVTLLLSFGKYFPLYRLFYMLPTISSIRNPNKFLQVFQVGIGILAALGVHHWFDETANRVTLKKRFVMGVGALGILMLLTAPAAGSGATIQRLSMSWGQAASLIAESRIAALVHGGILLLIATAGFWAATMKGLQQNTRVTLGAILAVFVMGDAVLLARHYVKSMPASFVESNDVFNMLKRVMPHQRVAVAAAGGFYQQWLTFAFPYHGIQTVNITQMPRMPEDYKAFLGTVGGNPFRMWEVCAVGPLLAPGQVWGQIQRDEQLKDRAELIYAYNIFPWEDSFQIKTGTAQQPGQHVLLRLKQSYGRWALVGAWEEAADPVALQKLSSPEYRVTDRVFVAPESAAKLAPMNNPGSAGEIELVEYRAGRSKVRVSTAEPSILRVADKYDPGWEAWIGGQPAEVLRVDYIFCGVAVPAGLHEVVLQYQTSKLPLAVQFLGLVFCATAAARLWQIKKRPGSEDPGR